MHENREMYEIIHSNFKRPDPFWLPQKVQLFLITKASELTFAHDCCGVLSHVSATLQLRRTGLLCHSSPLSQLFVALPSSSRVDWEEGA